MSTATHRHFPVTIAWSDEDHAFIARVPALRGCISHGATYEEAAANIREAIEGFLVVMAKHGDPLPEPDLAADEIRRFAPVLNVAKLARAAGLNYNTLASKLRRGSTFTAAEAKAIRRALERV